MSKHRFNKQGLLMTAAAATMTIMNAGASAQDAYEQDAASDDALDEILVKGVRAQILQSITAKRNSTQIMDTVSADDIGRQPDFNVGDALRRITGVSTIPEEDEGQFVTVRGINPDLTFLTFDGAGVAAASNSSGRRVSLEFFPADVVSGLEVIKTRTPSVDGNTIGGQVNMRTRSAFDADGIYAVGSAYIGKFTQDNAPFGINGGDGDNGLSYRLNGAFSATFGDNDQFGLVLAGSYFSKDRDEERIIPIGFNSSGDFGDPSSSFGPGLTIWSTYHNPIERWGGFAKLEYQATSDLYMSVQGQYFYQDDIARRESELLIPSGANTTFDTQFSGSFTGAAFFLGSDQFDAKNTYIGGQYVAEYENEDGWSADFRVSYSEGEFFESSPDIDFRGPSVDGEYTYNALGAPVVTFADPAFALDPANHPLNRVRPFETDIDNSIFEVEADFGHNYQGDGFGWQAGVKHRNQDQRDTRVRDVFLYTGGTATLADFQRPTDYSVLFRPGVPSLFTDFQAVFDFIAANPGDFTFTDNDPAIAYDITEKILAGYVALSYAGDNYQVIVGVRYENTDVESTDGSAGGYGNFLPSALLNYDISDNLKARFSYARAVGRPNPGDLTPIIEDFTGSTPTFSGGNPDLEARVADNFDLSLEYYFDGGRSLVSVAVFHKRIQNEIISLSTTGIVDGVSGIINFPRNAENADLTGIEIGLTKNSFEFLPHPLDGLGASLNYTYIDAGTTLVDGGALREVDFVFEQPSHIFNASVFYQYGSFEAKLTYNYMGEYHAGFAGDPGFLDIFGAYDTLDLQARYDVTDQISLIGEARNLMKEPLERFTGPGGVLLNDQSRFGRSFFFGITFKY